MSVNQEIIRLLLYSKHSLVKRIIEYTPFFFLLFSIIFSFLLFSYLVLYRMAVNTFVTLDGHETHMSLYTPNKNLFQIHLEQWFIDQPWWMKSCCSPKIRDTINPHNEIINSELKPVHNYNFILYSKVYTTRYYYK